MTLNEKHCPHFIAEHAVFVMFRVPVIYWCWRPWIKALSGWQVAQYWCEKLSTNHHFDIFSVHVLVSISPSSCHAIFVFFILSWSPNFSLSPVTLLISAFRFSWFSFASVVSLCFLSSIIFLQSCFSHYMFEVQVGQKPWQNAASSNSFTNVESVRLFSLMTVTCSVQSFLIRMIISYSKMFSRCSAGGQNNDMHKS